MQGGAVKNDILNIIIWIMKRHVQKNFDESNSSSWIFFFSFPAPLSNSFSLFLRFPSCVNKLKRQRFILYTVCTRHPLNKWFHRIKLYVALWQLSVHSWICLRENENEIFFLDFQSIRWHYATIQRELVETYIRWYLADFELNLVSKEIGIEE